MFSKVLIANRGEIAVRIIRACRELGVSPVAIHSDIDSTALHVQMADEAIEIGPAPATDSYLNIERVIEAAQTSQAEAVHPGYGFLSENPRFAAAVESSGLAFIGPRSSTIESLGNKTRARQIAASLGVPIVPGMALPTESYDQLHAEVTQLGLPVLLKAAAGGGGKGMRRVEREDELEPAFRLAQAEAVSAFGDPAIYAERWIERPRHIEIQILGDLHGEMIHLGERECSIQRRHQKLIEESPSPIDDPGLRHRMGEAALKIAKAVGYVSAGTVEFLVDEARDFHFLEVNTRLQVEHPVTEWVTGIDLVQLQIRLAAGERLGLSQSDINWRGSAIECRIYAEDADEDFTPTPGRIEQLRYPDGPGIRVDSGVYQGYRVPLEYDPLLAKLTVWAEDRRGAVERMKRALEEFVIAGVSTPIPLFRRIMEDRQFRLGAIHTNFLAESFHPSPARNHGGHSGGELSDEELAALVAVLRHRSSPAQAERAGSRNARGSPSLWKREGRHEALRER